MGHQLFHQCVHARMHGSWIAARRGHDVSGTLHRSGDFYVLGCREGSAKGKGGRRLLTKMVRVCRTDSGGFDVDPFGKYRELLTWWRA